MKNYLPILKMYKEGNVYDGRIFLCYILLNFLKKCNVYRKYNLFIMLNAYRIQI